MNQAILLEIGIVQFFLNSGILVIKLLDSRKVSSVRCVCIVEKRLIIYLSAPLSVHGY